MFVPLFVARFEACSFQLASQYFMESLQPSVALWSMCGIPVKGCRTKGCRPKGCRTRRLPTQGCRSKPQNIHLISWVLIYIEMCNLHAISFQAANLDWHLQSHAFSLSVTTTTAHEELAVRHSYTTTTAYHRITIAAAPPPHAQHTIAPQSHPQLQHHHSTRSDAESAV